MFFKFKSFFTKTRLHDLVAVLFKRIDFLTKENAELKHRLSKYENPKNCNNSSIPPSKDENRPKRKNLREKPDRKVKALKMVETPEFCNCCGNDISNNNLEFVDKRQFFDTPEINMKVTEHHFCVNLW